MRDVIIIKYGELWLKSESVRRRFITKLSRNIKSMLKRNGMEFTLSPSRDMMVLAAGPEAIRVLEHVFGISWFAKAKETEAKEKAIEKASLLLAEKIKPGETFAVRASRSDKSLPFTSRELERKIGAKIERKVDLSNPDFTIFIEVKKEKAYVYSEKIKGPGGMPYGVSGKVLSLISGGIDSPVAGWLMMKRGCSLDFIHFSTGKDGENKVKKLVEILGEYSPAEMNLHIVPFREILEGVMRHAERRMTCVLCKRLMYRISERFAEKRGAKALVTGENLAQVASQTLDNLYTNSKSVSIPILRPLIGMDKEEIMSLAKRIGTYDVSIEHSKPCSFVPKKPSTASKPEHAEEEEKKVVNLEETLREAMRKRRKVVI